MRDYDDSDSCEEFTDELPKYHDRDHPQVALAGTRALRAALERSSENACQLQDFWDVFQNFIRQHEHGAFVDVLVSELAFELRTAVWAERTDEFKQELIEELREEIRKECADTILSEVSTELREEVEAQVRTTLIREVEPVLRRELRAVIIEEIRPEVEVKLRGELMTDADFIASVKADLQRKILGL